MPSDSLQRLNFMRVPSPQHTENISASAPRPQLEGVHAVRTATKEPRSGHQNQSAGSAAAWGPGHACSSAGASAMPNCRRAAVRVRLLPHSVRAEAGVARRPRNAASRSDATRRQQTACACTHRINAMTSTQSWRAERVRLGARSLRVGCHTANLRAHTCKTQHPTASDAGDPTVPAHTPEAWVQPQFDRAVVVIVDAL